MSKTVALGLMFVFVGTCILPVVSLKIETLSQNIKGNWLYVGGGGPGNYTKIQDALDNASDGDTVFVFHGIYIENPHIEKQVHLLGENRFNTTIDGNALPYTVLIESDGVTISNFSIQNRGGNGLRIFSSDQVTVFQNRIFNTSCGIWGQDAEYTTVSSNHVCGNPGTGIAFRGSHNNLFSGNFISWNEYGLELDNCNNNTIQSNNVTLNNRSGIILGTDANNNTITDNHITSNFLDGLCIIHSSNFNTVTGNIIRDTRFGIDLYNSHHNSFSQNTLSYNMRGIDVISSNMNFIFDNEITSSSEGILLAHAYLNTIMNNTIAGNSRGITRLYDGENNTIFHNDFISNGVNAYEENVYQILFWDNGTEGNYWDDYTGSDANHDGIGDEPYTISENGSQDRYPLMSPHRMTQLAIIIQPHLFTVALRIKNVGNITAFHVGWGILATGGLIFFGRNVSGELPLPLPPGHEMNVTSHFFLFGLGRIKITYTAWAENAPIVSTEIQGILLFFFFKIMRR